jgi:hypothetical protein
MYLARERPEFPSAATNFQCYLGLIDEFLKDRKFASTGNVYPLIGEGLWSGFP